jgi:hypothetical protein
MTVLLILAAIVDVLLGVLLIAVSGFIIGSGPEGLGGNTSDMLVWIAGLVACIAAPIAGFVLRRFGRTGVGVLIALVPPAVALLLTSGIIHPY